MSDTETKMANMRDAPDDLSENSTILRPKSRSTILHRIDRIQSQNDYEVDNFDEAVDNAEESQSGMLS